MRRRPLLSLFASLLPVTLAHALSGPAQPAAAPGRNRHCTSATTSSRPTHTDEGGAARGSGADLRADWRARPATAPNSAHCPARACARPCRTAACSWAGAPGKPELADSTLECEHVLRLRQPQPLPPASRPAPRLPQDLSGSRLILINGYYWKAATQLLDDPALKLELHRTSTHAAALQMLLRGRGDYLLDYQAPVEQARKRACRSWPTSRSPICRSN
jgi:polar amino acid transport system substrate-binding protein